MHAQSAIPISTLFNQDLYPGLLCHGIIVEGFDLNISHSSEITTPLTEPQDEAVVPSTTATSQSREATTVCRLVDAAQQI